MTFGGQVNESDAARITDAAIDAGINFIDTANVYTDGLSESILGRILQGKRQDLILATKVGLTNHPEIKNSGGLTRRAIIREAEGLSLAEFSTAGAWTIPSWTASSSACPRWRIWKKICAYWKSPLFPRRP